MNGKIECSNCLKKYAPSNITYGAAITTGTFNYIQSKKSDFLVNSQICLNCLNNFRSQYAQEILEGEKGKLTDLEKEVIDSIKDQDIISENINNEVAEKLTFGDRIADRVAEFGGSWKFIICFGIFLLIWMTLNIFILTNKPFDPYPFILLNLVLSCLTAMQAPIIMMSQNRQSKKDRIKSEIEYQVNLKAELQTRQIIKKLDLFMTQQWQSFLEVQRIQSEITSDNTRTKNK